MKLSPASFALIAALLTSAPAGAADYVIDTDKAHASINWKIKHLGFSWLHGRFDTFKGTFAFDEGKPEASKVKVEVATDSINSNHAERDKHLRGKDFLDTAQFPTATFESTAVKLNGDKATITGNLTLHGVTKEIVIEAARVGGGADPWGGYARGLHRNHDAAAQGFRHQLQLGAGGHGRGTDPRYRRRPAIGQLPRQRHSALTEVIIQMTEDH